MRAKPEDMRVLAKLESRLGLKGAQVIRLALRKLADAEGIKH